MSAQNILQKKKLATACTALIFALVSTLQFVGVVEGRKLALVRVVTFVRLQLPVRLRHL